MKRTGGFAVVLAMLACTIASAQKVREFTAFCDSLHTLLKERTTVDVDPVLKNIAKQGNALNFYFSTSFGDYPWRSGDVTWLKDEMKKILPDNYKSCTIGEVYVVRNSLDKYIMPKVSNSGKPEPSRFRTKDPRPVHPFIEEVGGQTFRMGLSGRNIALWQSHGRYYDEETRRWRWQRAPLFQTVEDLYTQSYVLPFLIPMLENAGAYVMTPRERDIQTNEIIADNDPAFKEGRGAGVRLEGKYSETGEWSMAGTGFADTKAAYSGVENPFLTGTARKAACRGGDAQARWIPDIPEKGEYSVYISYKTLPHSTSCAHYTVRHLGGNTEFIVNQKMGGGTWVYLGTFLFDKGGDGWVTLDNSVPEGRSAAANAVVTADAVRFGGGMGKIARGQADSTLASCTVSGLPSSTEGAIYWMQWAGADSSILKLHDTDYVSDYADRGAWVGWMSGGSRTNPKEKGLKIPIDLSFAFHTDAGLRQCDSIVGTLSVYTLKCDGSELLPNGENRLQGRMFADFVQTQIVEDLRVLSNPEWNRRGLWDRSYSESRTTTVPGMLLELLSHQNFNDMKYGLDPEFRFNVSRAIYKGMLKYLSSRYGCGYAVQPLPVNSFATKFRTGPSPGQSGRISLSWKVTEDPLEPTAVPTGYILYTRVDDGAFDSGEVLQGFKTSGDEVSVDLSIPAGHIYSYRVVAYNDGGKSFPSETLSIGVPKAGSWSTVAIVNNFTRVGPPSWFDTPGYGGFRNEVDGGVPYMREINFIGKQYENRKEITWKDDDSPGFGGSYTDQAGETYPGNTFDFTSIHGKAILAAGHAFHSVSSSAFISDESLSKGDWAMDMICGKQVTTLAGCRGKTPAKFTVFSSEMQEAIKRYTAAGGNVLLSGANIGTDIWDQIYPYEPDEEFRKNSIEFAENVLGFRWMTNFATNGTSVWPMKNAALDMTGSIGRMGFHRYRNKVIYNVETPDGIVPASDKSQTFLRYTDTNISAAVCFEAEHYKTACIGLPIEVLEKQSDINALIERILKYFEK